MKKTFFLIPFIFATFFFNTVSVFSESLILFEGCVDQFGINAVSVVDYNIPFVAAASRDSDGTPIIYYNPRALSWFKNQTRLFCYAHECGHHVLGHTIGELHPDFMEQEADCWAIRELISKKKISKNDIDIIAEDMARLFGAGSDVHLPGTDRALNLYGCFE